ncbi:MAG: hypothetical protein IPO09_01960 [Anaeromyxobacter sp.]|nr:hypothetical protein [Anaeromyxobacter sp.]MBL0278076.1 hypothetical protein [Anaeromyxobacter sp.]
MRPDLGVAGLSAEDLAAGTRRFSLADVFLAVRWIEAGVQREHVARTLGVSTVTLRRWFRLWADAMPDTGGRRFAIQQAANQVHLEALRFVIDSHLSAQQKELFARRLAVRYRLVPSRAKRLLGLGATRPAAR